ncbi:hypothetical protein JH26_02240 [Microvirga sp. BSC39]|nr:hypothetical protein JH26_02240 [Microvirga sp. BSC39]
MLWTLQQHYPYFRTKETRSYDFPTLRDEKWTAEHKAPYLDSIAEADTLIGNLVNDLRDLKLLDETLIIVTGDHGEAFQQHGSFGHGKGLYEEEVHVPLLLINPRLFPFRSTERVVGHIDIAPTVLDVLAIPSPSEWQGKSLFQPKREEPIYFFTAWLDYKVGYRLGSRKSVVSLLSDQVETYNLDMDPQEKINTSAKDPTIKTVEKVRIIDWVHNQNKFILSKMAPKSR